MDDSETKPGTATRSLPNLSAPAAVRTPGGFPLALAEAVLAAALQAHKAGALDELIARRPRAARRFMRRYAGPVLGTAGQHQRQRPVDAGAVVLVLRWLVAALRPDRADGLADIPREAWLERTSWRPMLALMCQFGLAPVAEFRDRYRPRPDEAAADHLCGLWGVGPSTYYRYLDKGRRKLAELYLRAAPLPGEAGLSLRRAVQQALYERHGLHGAAERAAWHRERAAAALVERDPVAALWHSHCAGDVREVTLTLLRFRIELAAATETDALVERCLALAQTARERFDLWLAQAMLWKARHADERELHAYEQALHIAHGAGDKLMLGRAYGALGKYHEPRDIDRALACFEDSAEFSRLASAESGADAAGEALCEYVAALQKLAWFYVLRNDARCRVLLDQAEALRGHPAVGEETAALLEQSWGEYWRRAGDLRRAVAAKHRALNIYERLGDKRQVLSMYNNLSLAYAEAKEFALAIDYGRRVLAMAQHTPVEPYLLASALMNLGVAHFWQAQYQPAIDHYRQALELSERAGLRLSVNRAHYNLAEAHYKRFQSERDPQDERAGDAHAAQAMKASAAESDSGHLEATRNLKAEILGPHEGFTHDRLLPEEVAAHADEMGEVHRQRVILALPGAPEAHVRAHLAIARAYLAISAREREAARALIERHGLPGGYAAEFEALHAAFHRELTREQVLAARWQHGAGEWLAADRRALLLNHLLGTGAIGKSAYAQLCGVGLATASKHLGLLAACGLLMQTGKGPATRYRLADDEAG